MYIEENKVYLFKFRTDDGEIAIPQRAETQEEAVRKIQGLFARMQTELAMDFPQVKEPSVVDHMVAALASGSGTMPVSPVPIEVLEMRLDTLLDDLGAGNLTLAAKAQTVENWTGIKYREDNYPKIITELELIKSGAKEIPSPPAKKEKKA